MLRYYILVIILLLASTLQAQNIDYAEYFIDAYQGPGQGTVVTINTTGEDITQTFNVNLSGIPEGIHMLGVRTRDTDGKWSLPAYRIFIVETFPAAPKIMAAEYYVDEDPGVGSGKSITIDKDSSDITQSFEVDLTGVAPGFHTLYVRVQDAYQNWSIVGQRAFVVKDSYTLENITALHYYYIKDEKVVGEEEYVYALPEPVTSVDLTFPATVTPLENGEDYLLYIWAVTESEKRSLVNIKPFTYNKTLPISLEVTKSDIACFGDNNGTITANATGGEGTLLYSISTDSSNFSATHVFENLDSGTYTIYVHGADEDYVESKTVEIIAPENALNLALDGQVTQPSCEAPTGGSFTVAASGGAGDSYQYKLNDMVYQDSPSFNNLSAGDYIVTVQDANSCTATQEVTINSTGDIPDKPVITIDQDADSSYYSTEVILSVDNVTGNFQWYKDGEPIENATDSKLILSEAGNYTVTVTNEAGCSATSEGVTITGIEDEWSSVTNIYPNPVKNQLFIDFPSALQKSNAVKMYLYNLQGSLVAQKSLQHTSAVSIELPNLNEGIYFIVLQSEGFLVRKKIQKIRDY